MRKVRYICDPLWASSVLTPGKIYDVIKYISRPNSYSDEIVILNDYGVMNKVLVNSYLSGVEFEDVTMELRNGVIDNILG